MPTWEPTVKVIDPRLVVDNLLAYIEEFSGDAVTWANDGVEIPWSNGGGTGTGFAALYPNATGWLNTIFPALVTLTKKYETDLSGEALQGGLELLFEATITGPDADALSVNADKYAMALESLLANVTSGDLMAGVMNPTHASLFEIGTVFDVIKGQKGQKKNWVQIFQTKVLYKLTAAAF